MQKLSRSFKSRPGTTSFPLILLLSSKFIVELDCGKYIMNDISNEITSATLNVVIQHAISLILYESIV